MVKRRKLGRKEKSAYSAEKKDSRQLQHGTGSLIFAMNHHCGQY